jgi:CHAT domain-containing protein
MERFDLRFVSSTKDILGAAPEPAAKSAVLIGDPLFDLSEQQQFASLKKLALPQPLRNPDLPVLASMSGARGKAEGATLPPLPGTGVEVTAIASVMQNDGWKTSVYTRDQALKQVVAMAGSARVLHIATHGFFLPDPQLKPDSTSREKSLNSEMEDPMLRSGLYFAGANRALAGQSVPAGLDNGILTALEAGDLNLTGTELVVLSACNTGQGDVKNGEGVFGLRRALQEAGAQTVLMSLWSVPDKETLELMNLFYAKWLAGTEKHEALKQAQLAVREEVKRDHDGRDLPFYWGAFVLVGK